MIHRSCLASLTLALLWTESLSAGPIAFTLSGTFTTSARSSATRGYQFTVQNFPIEISKLGALDVYPTSGSPDGFGPDAENNPTSASVRVWSVNDASPPSQPEAVASISSTASLEGDTLTGTTWSGRFRYVDITPVTLSPGNYRIVAYYGALDYFVSEATLAPGSSEVAFVASYGATAPAVYPDQAAGVDNGFFGPNFQYTAVPEPSSLAFLVSVTTGALLWRRSRRRRRSTRVRRRGA